jgi:hypothetical protein
LNFARHFQAQLAGTAEMQAFAPVSRQACVNSIRRNLTAANFSSRFSG